MHIRVTDVCPIERLAEQAQRVLRDAVALSDHGDARLLEHLFTGEPRGLGTDVGVASVSDRISEG